MLRLDDQTRAKLWKAMINAIERYTLEVDGYPIGAQSSAKEIQDALSVFDFSQSKNAIDVLNFAVQQLSENQVHTPSVNYYGLFNPAPTTMGIAADALVAAFNPQLAAWNHSPFAIELEQHLVRCFAERFGYDGKKSDGTFTTGGAEANHTALVTALTHRYPQVRTKGLRALPAQPVMYVSGEAHHSIVKAARISGLGADAVREVSVNQDLQMDINALQMIIAADKKKGLDPFMLVATAGSTNSGAVDPLVKLAPICNAHHMWFHIDAAWGGAAIIVPELKSILRGCERADSITFDCHKWLSVPMGAGLYLTRHVNVLDQTFRVLNDYMPKDGTEQGLVDPYAHSMQWSRRFIGLKVFLSLATEGWDGYARALRHQAEMGGVLRRLLDESDWEIVNETLLPVVCFTDKSELGKTPEFLEWIARSLYRAGTAWISTTRLGNGMPVLRACITNYRTAEADIERLVKHCNAARKAGRTKVAAQSV